jgi:hypothetical protein
MPTCHHYPHPLTDPGWLQLSHGHQRTVQTNKKIDHKGIIIVPCCAMQAMPFLPPFSCATRWGKKILFACAKKKKKENQKTDKL